MLHIRLVQQYHRCSDCHVQLSASSLVWRRPRYEDEPHYLAQAILFKTSVWCFVWWSEVYNNIPTWTLAMPCAAKLVCCDIWDEEKMKNTTHQLNKRQSSIAVGHDKDILGFCFGHKVVPHVHHVFLGGSVFLQQQSNFFYDQQKVDWHEPPESEGCQCRQKSTQQHQVKDVFPWQLNINSSVKPHQSPQPEPSRQERH